MEKKTKPIPIIIRPKLRIKTKQRIVLVMPFLHRNIYYSSCGWLGGSPFYCTLKRVALPSLTYDKPASASPAASSGLSIHLMYPILFFFFFFFNSHSLWETVRHDYTTFFLLLTEPLNEPSHLSFELLFTAKHLTSGKKDVNILSNKNIEKRTNEKLRYVYCF